MTERLSKAGAPAMRDATQPHPREQLPRVLCVDDDPAVLRATRRVLATHFNVTMAVGGLTALDAVRQAESPFAAVVSDLRMPELTGIGLLQCVRQHAPETSRVLLTGYADVPSAVDAVNAGEIFRFLTKPCPPEALIEAVAAACAHHERTVAMASSRQSVSAPQAPTIEDARGESREAADPTGGGTAVRAAANPVNHVSEPARQLDGYVSVLRSVFAAARPMASECANRIERRVTRVLEHVHLSVAEHVTVAAALSQLGSIGVPVDIAERIYGGWAVSADDRACASGIRSRSADLVSASVDLALVQAILAPERLATLRLPDESTPHVVDECEVGARIVEIACMLDEIERRGAEQGAVLRQLAELERDPGKHDEILVDAFRAALRAPAYEGVRTIRLRDALPSMVLAADVVAPNGLLIARRGQRIGDIVARRTSQTWSSAVLEQSVDVIDEPADGSELGGIA